MDPAREKAFQDYRKKLMEHKEVESRLKDSKKLCRIITIYFSFLCIYFYINLISKVNSLYY